MWYSGPACSLHRQKEENAKAKLKRGQGLSPFQDQPGTVDSLHLQTGLLTAVLIWSYLHVVGSITSEVRIDLWSNKPTDSMM